jgi:hypothetical protein
MHRAPWGAQRCVAPAETILPKVSFLLRKEIISDIVICVVFLGLFSLYGYIFLAVNSMDAAQINVYPNYFYMYGLHFGLPLIVRNQFDETPLWPKNFRTNI